MDLLVFPTESVNGTVSVPSSKSYTHRYIFLSLLSSGTSILNNPLICNDTEASLDAISKFGAHTDWLTIKSDGVPKTPKRAIQCKRSGTTCRFASSIGILVKGPTLLVGSEQLSQRPMKDLFNVLREMGAKIEAKNDKLPAKIWGGKIKKRDIEISGKVSSQFISALLILGSKIGIDINIKDDLVSRGYVDMTIRVLRELGINVYNDDYSYLHVDPRELKARNHNIMGDYSSASYWIAAAAINGKLNFRRLDKDDLQPDRKILDIVRDMGANIIWRKNYLEVSADTLEGIEIYCKDTPDLVPIISVLGAFSKGKTIIYGVSHARYKETDRIKTTIFNLKQMRIEVEEKDDGMVIKGGGAKAGVFNSFWDHRIAMAFIVASLFLDSPSYITNINVINDSYPTFLQDLIKVGGRYEFYDR